MSKPKVEQVYLTGLARYAHIQKPTAKYKTQGRTALEREFRLDLELATKDDVARYNSVKEKFGVPDTRTVGGSTYPVVKTTDNGTPYISLKTSAGFIDPTTNQVKEKVFRIKDQFGKPLPEDAPLIGNGSRLVVSVNVVENKDGAVLYLDAVLVKNLIPYASGADFSGFIDESDSEEGDVDDTAVPF